VNGGQNAGCDGLGSNGHTHTADCGVTVTGIGLADAEKIFFLGFTGLSANATMCNARTATVVQANNLFGNGSQQSQSTQDAWEAVGVTAALCGS
jgi:Zn-dependent metalloprotease